MVPDKLLILLGFIVILHHGKSRKIILLSDFIGTFLEHFWVCMDNAAKIQMEYERLERQFSPSKLLSPAQLAPIVSISVGTLANQRLQGFHLLPSRKMGGKVGFYIGDVAAYLVEGSACPSVVEQLVRKNPAKDKKLPTSRPLTSNKWMLAMRENVMLNHELLDEIERCELFKRTKESGKDSENGAL